MKSPARATILALVLSDYARTHAADAAQRDSGSIASDATRAVAIAAQVRRLVEHSCNVELTSRQEKRLESLRRRADELLKPYGLCLANPWGLCFYATPIDHDGCSETGCTFLA